VDVSKPAGSPWLTHYRMFGLPKREKKLPKTAAFSGAARLTY